MSARSGVRAVARTKPTRRARWRARVEARHGERGYIMVTTVIMLPLLLILVSAATDVTYYYSKTVEIQRIADTSALAGVVRMPNLPDAQNVAYEVAVRNGMQNANAGVTVTAEAPTGTNRRLKVTVRDTRVKLFFGSLFKEYWDITRTSTAEYVSNIPLGSVLNAIGTGDLTGAVDPATGLPTVTGNGLSATPQNFWLSVAGPCAAKEAGDQLSSRYDGTNMNANYAPGNSGDNRFYRLCDWVNATADQASRLTQIGNNQTAAPAGLFPALSINRDHDPVGYNYIVDVPCLPLVAGGAVPPPPCPAGQVISQDLKLEMFDPVFNPDSLQRFTSSNVVTKPDQYGVRRKGSNTCTSTAYLADQTACRGTYAAGAVSPADVRVVTEVRVFPADNTPVDYSDDVPLDAPASLNRTSSATEINKIQRFGSCINATDGWTIVGGGGSLTPVADANHDYIPDTVGGDIPLSAIPAGDVSADADCATNAAKWRSLITIPSGQPRGRYRINVRTVSSPSAYGTNAFSLRASFGANFASCSSLTNTTTCPSVSGDSSMSVFASVPGISDFYLAQLSPASLFRNKTVVLQLWDVGEGGDTVEVLRPISQSSQCPSTPMVGLNYCVQPFDWSIWNPGVNRVDSANALNPAGQAMADVCVGKGQTNQIKLSVAGHWDTSLSSAPGYTPTGNTVGNSLCTATVDTGIVQSRGGFAPLIKPYSSGTPSGLCSLAGSVVSCQSGRFNDRTVALQIQIPKDYGCTPGTGTDTVPCTDATTLPEGGWWRIRYTPLQKTWDSGGYVEMTDQTTWTVQLLGDPVHLVQEG
jgi:Flp pilus assembly protein TadG